MKPKPLIEFAKTLMTEFTKFKDSDDTRENETDRLAMHLDEDRRNVAGFYRDAIIQIYTVTGARKDSCKSCGQTIWWLKMKSGKQNPFTVDGVSHFSDCKQANQHRRKK